MKRELTSLAALSAVSTFAALAHAATFPADGAWIALLQDGAAMTDAVTDGNGDGLEIVGTDQAPAAYLYADSTNLFVRLRIDTDPTQGGTLHPYGWGVLIDTDGDLDDYEFSLMVNAISNPDTIQVHKNTVPLGTGDPTDEADQLITTYPWNAAAGGNGRVVDAGSHLGGSDDFFLDFAVPIADLAAAGLDLGSPLVFWAGTSSTGRSITVDLAGTILDPGPGILPLAASDPINFGELPVDIDDDGITGDDETAAGTDSFDADSDDDGVPDGDEPSWDEDSDDDGLINALDSDSDDDGLFDGTELGLGCNGPGTDPNTGDCVADADGGTTTTDPLLADTDDGGVADGIEDANHNGRVEASETDPNNPDDDEPCDDDGDCGNATSGVVCDTEASHVCIEGCRGTGGNGCPSDEICTSDDASIGDCEPAGTGGGGTGGSGEGGSGNTGGTGQGGSGNSGNTGGSGNAGGSGVGLSGVPTPRSSEIWAEGGLCAASPGHTRPSAGAWLLGLAALAGLARGRRRAARRA